MIISVYGAGYVGLVSSACFAQLGHQVICVDINAQRIENIQQGKCPIFEDQLPELLKSQQESGRLRFSADPAVAMESGTVHFIATGTPSLADGSADLSQVFAVVRQLVKTCKHNSLIVTKSTVPVGTGDEIEQLIVSELKHIHHPPKFDVASNPEFLREGTAVNDFFNADRIVIGGTDEALLPLKIIYQPLVDNGVSLVVMSRRSAELTKYSANAMLACKISFINQISQLAEKLGANIDDIRDGVGLDKRINPHFLQAGVGYGGSCFPKDIKALKQTSISLGVSTPLLDAIEVINKQQKNWAFSHIKSHFKSLTGLTIGIWGLAFKPGTDDMREASSLVLIEQLLKANVTIFVYDPVAMDAAKRVLPQTENIHWCDCIKDTLNASLNGLVIMTEWPEFKDYPLMHLAKSLQNAPIFDGRNCFTLNKIESAGIACYYSVGRPTVIHKNLTAKSHVI